MLNFLYFLKGLYNLGKWWYTWFDEQINFLFFLVPFCFTYCCLLLSSWQSMLPCLLCFDVIFVARFGQPALLHCSLPLLFDLACFPYFICLHILLSLLPAAILVCCWTTLGFMLFCSRKCLQIFFSIFVNQGPNLVICKIGEDGLWLKQATFKSGSTYKP